MDWGHSLIGQLLGSEYQVIFFFSALTWGIFLTVHLFSIPEQPLDKDPCFPDTSPPSALRLLSSHGNGYGSLAKDPVPPVAPASISDLRPRSFSALGEANSVTSSAKQPNKEVCNVSGDATVHLCEIQIDVFIHACHLACMNAQNVKYFHLIPGCSHKSVRCGKTVDKLQTPHFTFPTLTHIWFICIHPSTSNLFQNTKIKIAEVYGVIEGHRKQNLSKNN